MYTAEVKINNLPSTLDEFKAMKQIDLTKPENTCIMFLCSLGLFIKDRNTGIAAINY